MIPTRTVAATVLLLVLISGASLVAAAGRPLEARFHALEAASNASSGGGAEAGSASTTKISTATLVGYLLADVVLLCGAALFAGLTLSVMGLDTMSLEIIASSGQEPDKTYATKILPIRKKGNQLLCTLILGNVMVNTLIAQITDRFISGWLGVALSTALITVGGEILPQATMAAHALQVGAGSAPVVRFFLTAFYPICKPLSTFLDRVIGNDPGQVYEREELKKLFALHAHEHGAASGLAASDVNLLFGAMDLGSVTVADVMTPIADVFMLEASERLDANQLQRIWQSGHSRIPVYKSSRTQIVGVLYAKDLLMVNAAECARIHDFIKFHRRHIIAVTANRTLMAMLREFQTGSSHIALVRRVTIHGSSDPVYETAGIVTLDDVIARLIGDVVRDDELDGIGEGDDDHYHHHGHASPASTSAASGALVAAGGMPSNGPLVTNAAALLYGSPSARQARVVGNVSGAALRLVRATTMSANQRRVTVSFLREHVGAFARIPTSAAVEEFVSTRGLLYEAIAPANARGMSLASKRNVWLYKLGQESTFFTLIVQGDVQAVLPATRSSASTAPEDSAAAASTAVTVTGGASSGNNGGVTVDRAAGGGEPLFMDLPPWSVLGSPVLALAGPQAASPLNSSISPSASAAAAGRRYVPDYSARVVSTATILQFHVDDLRAFFSSTAADPSAMGVLSMSSTNPTSSMEMIGSPSPSP